MYNRFRKLFVGNSEQSGADDKETSKTAKCVNQLYKDSDAYINDETKKLIGYVWNENESKWIWFEESDISSESINDNKDEKELTQSEIDEKDEKSSLEAAQSKLRVLSFNIWFDRREQVKRFEKLLEIISSDSINPDIICLQEVTPFFMKTILSKNKFMQTNYIISDNPNNPNTFVWYGTLIVIKKSLILNQNANNIAFYQSEFETKQMRNLLTAKIVSSKSKDYNSEIWVNTVHLESIDENVEFRKKQLKLIFDTYMNSKQLEMNSNDSATPSVGKTALLMGDFNFDDGDAENELIDEKIYNDCWKQYIKNCKQSGSINQQSDLLINGITQIYMPDPTNDSVKFCRRLDKMLYCSDRWELESFDIIGEWNMPSDHLGIFSIFASKSS